MYQSRSSFATLTLPISTQTERTTSKHITPHLATTQWSPLSKGLSRQATGCAAAYHAAEGTRACLHGCCTYAEFQQQLMLPHCAHDTAVSATSQQECKHASGPRRHCHTVPDKYPCRTIVVLGIPLLEGCMSPHREASFREVAVMLRQCRRGLMPLHAGNSGASQHCCAYCCC